MDALAAVVVLCAIDLRCTSREKTRVVARVKDELKAGGTKAGFCAVTNWPSRSAACAR